MYVPSTTPSEDRSSQSLAEEVEDASLVVPRCMWWAYVLNVAMGFIMLITMLFCTGDLADAISSSDPYINLVKNMGKTSIAILLSVILFLLIFSGNITALATTSREVWAFSRDRGFPFSNWISRVSHAVHTKFPNRWLSMPFSDEPELECPLQRHLHNRLLHRRHLPHRSRVYYRF